MISEKPAGGVKGFLLYSPFTHKHFFRVYESEDKRKFTDYDLRAEDIEVELLSDYNSLYKNEESGNAAIDFSSKVLGRMPKLS